MRPKSDTNPLTPCEQLYYIHPRLARHSPKPKEEPKPRENPSPGPRGLNVPAHPKGRSTRRPTAQAKAAISSSKGPGSPSPQLSGDGRSIDSKQHVGLRDRPTRRTIHPARSSQRYAHSPAKFNSPPMQGLLRAIEPLWDSTVVTIGEFRSVDDGSGFVLSFIRMVEPSVLWTRHPASLVQHSKDTWGNRRLASRPCPRVPDLPSPTPSPTNQPKPKPN